MRGDQRNIERRQKRWRVLLPGLNYECPSPAQPRPGTKVSTNKSAVNYKNCQIHVHEEDVESRSYMGVPAKIERFRRLDELEAGANLNVQLCETH